MIDILKNGDISTIDINISFKKHEQTLKSAIEKNDFSPRMS